MPTHVQINTYIIEYMLLVHSHMETNERILNLRKNISIRIPKLKFYRYKILYYNNK